MANRMLVVVLDPRPRPEKTTLIATIGLIEVAVLPRIAAAKAPRLPGGGLTAR